jgi:hypothetical protein
LRRLSETNPDLANKIVDHQENRDIRGEKSYRIALCVAGVLAITIVAGGSFVLVALGIWQAITFVLVLLGGSHILRAVLKGEFSNTSWFGSFLSSTKKDDDADS